MTKKINNLTHRKRSSTEILLVITIGLFIALYCISLVAFKDDNFGKYSVFFNFLNNNAYLLMLSLGLTVVMVTGSIDISVGGVTGLVSMTIAVMLLNDKVSAVWAVVAALGIGLAFGVVQGFLVAYLEIQPFIVTLTGMFFARGMTSVVRTISVPITRNTKGGEMFLNWAEKKIFMQWMGPNGPIPLLYNIRRNGSFDIAYLTPAALIALLILVLLIIMMKYSKIGRSFYAVGGNSQSALLMGIDPKKTKFIAHILCGALAGMGGLFFTLMFTSGSPMNGTGYEIDAISSSVIGGAMLSGGAGLPIGTFFGVMINGLVAKVVTLLNLEDPSWPRIVTSVFLFGFIVLQSLLSIYGKNEGGIQEFYKKLKVKRKDENDGSIRN